MPRDSGILVTDFGCSYKCESRVDHSVLDKACLPGFLQRFLHFVYNDTITPAEHAGKVRGHFAMERNVRQGCLASGFLVTMAFDPGG